MIYKSLFHWGARLRNPSLLPQLKALITSQNWSRTQLEDFQQERLRELLIWAQRAPYYQKLFTDLQLDPERKWDPGDFQKLPILDKATLLDQNEAIHTQYPWPKLFFCETSGSTGQVLTFRRNERWDSFNRASIWRGYQWHGVQPWDRNLYFWGYNFGSRKRLKTRILDAAQNRFRLFDYRPETLRAVLPRLKQVVYIHGYSSMIYELARLVLDQVGPLELPKLKMIKGTSEKIFPHYQETIRQAFGRNMISEYGAAESGIIAFECASGNMHLNMEGCLVEEVDHEILVTNLLSHSFPIIRYRLGDTIRLGDPKYTCPCGLAHPILEEVTGRIGKNLIGKTGHYPSLTLYYIFKNLFFEKGLKLNYQAHQYQKGQLVYRLTNALSPDLERQIRLESGKYFGVDMDLVFEQVETLQTYQGKLKDFISHIEA
ncbi:MAG: phenylacetate--CoA ligase family protein [Acidobacteria bacterium]|nr:phenylacetate--CoA ligase family protein [Acidobacteriota bacterium]